MRRVLAVSAEVAAAEERLLEASYAKLDTVIADLDLKLRLCDAVQQAQGYVAGEAHGRSEGEGEGAEGAEGGGANGGDGGEDEDEGGGGGGGGGRRKRASEAAVGGGDFVTGTGAGAGGHKSKRAKNSLMDIAIDPAEPTYCTCGQVAFGEMIACDNDACPIEWFHQSCVGFKSYDKHRVQKWFCSACREEQHQ